MVLVHYSSVLHNQLLGPWLSMQFVQLLLHHYVKDMTVVPSLASADVWPLKCSAQICAVGPQTCHPTQSYAIAPTAGHILVA